MLRGMSGGLDRRLGLKAALIRFLLPALIILPALTFYLAILPYTVNVPFLDDFGSILPFSKDLATTSGLLNKLALFATTQYNDYKLIFENAIVAIYLEIFKKIDFQFLQILGDGFPVLIGLALYLLWKETITDRGLQQRRAATALVTFLPVPYLIFQLNYWETLNFAMAGLQNVPVVAFALLCIWCLTKPGRGVFLAACALFALAVFSNGNGLLLAPTGAVLLVQLSAYRRVIAWCAISAILIGIYFYDYHAYEVSGPLLELPWQISVPYALSFLGSAFADFSANPHASAFAGGILLAVLAVLFVTSAARRESRGILYSALFVVLTAVGVSATRSKYGLGESLEIHYRIYSDVLVILCYFVFVKRLGGARPLSAVAVLCSFAFAVAANLMAMSNYGALLRQRRAVLVCQVVERRTSGAKVLGIDLQDLPEANRILARAEALGIYALPELEVGALLPGARSRARGPGMHEQNPGQAGHEPVSGGSRPVVPRPGCGDVLG